MAKRRRAAIATFAACAVAAVGVVSPVGQAAINDQPGKGNPAVNPSGKCPPGQNTETSPGGLKKCS